MANTPPFTDIPATAADWRIAARRAGVEYTTLRSYNSHQSASCVTREQYLTFRTLVVSRPPGEFNAGLYGLIDELERASVVLAESSEFSNYLEIIRAATANGIVDAPNALVSLSAPGTAPSLGYFAAIPEQLSEIAAGIGPQGAQHSLIQMGEKPVSAVLCNLLKAITSVAHPTRAWWRLSEYHLKANFGHVGTEPQPRGYTAITDGQLHDRYNWDTRALIDCKRDTREDSGMHVDRREAATMLVWIQQFPGRQRYVCGRLAFSPVFS